MPTLVVMVGMAVIIGLGVLVVRVGCVWDVCGDPDGELRGDGRRPGYGGDVLGCIRCVA